MEHREQLFGGSQDANGCGWVCTRYRNWKCFNRRWRQGQRRMKTSSLHLSGTGDLPWEPQTHHSAATSVNPWQMQPHPTFFPLEKSSCPSQVWSFGFYVPQSCIKFRSIGNVLFYPVSGILLWSALMYHTRFHYYILGVSKFTELSVTFLTLTFLLSCNSRHCPRLCLVHEVDVTETR